MLQQRTASTETLGSTCPRLARLMTGRRIAGTEKETGTKAGRETGTGNEETAETGTRSEESEIETGRRTAGTGTETGTENVKGMSHFIFSHFYINIIRAQEHYRRSHQAVNLSPSPESNAEYSYLCSRHERDREHDRERKPRSYFSRSAHEEVKNEMRAAEERLQAQWPTGADIKMDKQAPQLPQTAPQLPQGQQQQQQQPQQPQQPIPPQHAQQPSKP